VTTARVTGLLTAADLSYERDDGLRRELHDGVVHVVSPPSDSKYRDLVLVSPPESGCRRTHARRGRNARSRVKSSS